MTKQFKIGDKLRYLGGDRDVRNNLTVDGIYEIVDVSTYGTATIVDDTNSCWDVSADNKNANCFELVTGSQTPKVCDKCAVIYDTKLDEFRYVTELDVQTPVEASPTVIELLANISRRLYEAERTIKEQAYEINELYRSLVEQEVAERG